MLKMIIADDERVIRETISTLIDWEKIGIRLIGLCQDGIEAYNMILDESPDIVMTDIQMPGLSGLELIQEITGTDKQIQFILLSGYEEFDYAREAMKYGVRHYLLKPCSEEQITESVQEASRDCLQARQSRIQREQSGAMVRTIQQDILYHLLVEGLWASPDSDIGKRMDTMADFYGPYMDFCRRPCCLYYVYFLEESRLPGSLDSLKELEARQSSPLFFYGVYVKNTLLLFCFSHVDSRLLDEAFSQVSSGIRLEEHLFPDLTRLLEEVLWRIRRYDTVYAIHGFRPLPVSNHTAMEHIQTVCQGLETANKAGVHRLFGELRLMVSQAVQPEFLKTFAGSVCPHLSSMDALSSVEAAEFIKTVSQTEDFTVLGGLIEQMLSKAENALSRSSHNYGALAEKIMDYVNAHLSDQSLTLKKISEEYLYMNVDYVSRQFRKSTGRKFSQYLTEQRVRRAKELLSHEDTAKIQYVAEQVGCGNNPQYFSQIFKKTVGMTPGKWASKIRSGTDRTSPQH